MKSKKLIVYLLIGIVLFQYLFLFDLYFKMNQRKKQVNLKNF